MCVGCGLVVCPLEAPHLLSKSLTLTPATRLLVLFFSPTESRTCYICCFGIKYFAAIRRGFPSTVVGSHFSSHTPEPEIGFLEPLLRVSVQPIPPSPLTPTRYRFSAFWLRSSVVSVLISLISDTSPTRGPYIKLIFGTGSWNRSLLRPLHASTRYCSSSWERCTSPPCVKSKARRSTRTLQCGSRHSSVLDGISASLA